MHTPLAHCQRRLTQKALLSDSLSATDAETVVRCVDAVAARGSGSCLPYLEADLLRADHVGGGDKGDNGEKEMLYELRICYV